MSDLEDLKALFNRFKINYEVGIDKDQCYLATDNGNGYSGFQAIFAFHEDGSYIADSYAVFE
jgi:hypothetical protein